VEEAKTADEDRGLAEGDVVTLVHSGSRGYGGNVLQKFMADSQDSLHEDSEQAKEYLKAHDTACRWAQADRDLIALRFLSCLEPGEDAWELGRNMSTPDSTTPEDAISRAKVKLQQRKVVDVSNSVQTASYLLNSAASGLRQYPLRPLSMNFADFVLQPLDLAQ